MSHSPEKQKVDAYHACNQYQKEKKAFYLLLVGHPGVDVALADLGSRVQELQKYVRAVNENEDDVGHDEIK